MAQNNFFNRLFNRDKKQKARIDESSVETNSETEAVLEEQETLVETVLQNQAAKQSTTEIQSTSTELIPVQKSGVDQKQEQLVSFLTGYFNEKFDFILDNHIFGDGRDNTDVASGLIMIVDDKKEKLVELFRLSQDALRDFLTDQILYIGAKYFNACKSTYVTESDKRKQLVSDAKEIGNMFSNYTRSLTKEIFVQESNSIRRKISALQNTEYDDYKQNQDSLEFIQKNMDVVDFVCEYLEICKTYAENGVSIFLDLQNSDVKDYIVFIKKHQSEFKNQELVSKIIRLPDAEKLIFFDSVYASIDCLLYPTKGSEDEYRTSIKKEHSFLVNKLENISLSAIPNMTRIAKNLEKLLSDVDKYRKIEYVNVSDFMNSISSHNLRGDDASDSIDSCLQALIPQDFAFKYNILKLWHEYLKESSMYLQTKLRRDVVAKNIILEEKELAIFKYFKEFETAENARLNKSMFMPD